MKLANLVSLLVLIAISSFAQSKEVTLVHNIYYTKIEITNVTADIRVNDFPVAKHSDASGFEVEESINNLLVQGENSLSISLAPLNDAETIVGTVKVVVYLHDNTSDFPKEKQRHIDFTYPSEAFPAPQANLNQKLVFELSDIPTLKLWNNTEKVTALTAADKSDILKIVNELEQSILTGAIDRAIALQDFKLTDDALAEGKSKAQIAEAVSFNYNWIAEQKPVAAEKLTPENISFELVANGRAVYVSKKSGSEAIELESEELGFELPTFVAKTAAGWQIVR